RGFGSSARCRSAVENPSDFTLIGKPTRRTDSLAKTTGAAKFGLDTRLPGMLIASVERSPVYGGAPRRFNADEVKSAPPGGTADLRHPSKLFITALAFHLKPRPR